MSNTLSRTSMMDKFRLLNARPCDTVLCGKALSGSNNCISNFLCEITSSIRR